MQFIVACDRNWGIGRAGDMLYHLPKDLAFFKKITYGHIVVMGRKTYESLPNQKALEGRVNIVLSKQRQFSPKDARVVGSILELENLLEKDYKDKKVFLIGGGMLYETLLDKCTGGYVTHIAKKSSEVDTYFPNLELKLNWRKDALMQTENSDEVAFQIWHYQNTKGENNE